MDLQWKDILALGEGQDAFNKTTKIQRFRDKVAPPVVVSRSEAVWIRFSTGSSVAKSVEGYDLEIHALSNESECDVIHDSLWLGKIGFGFG